MRVVRHHVKAVLCVLGISLMLFAGVDYSQEKSRHADSGFSFDVYGDSRSMMYLPYKQDQEAQARQFMTDIFELVLPEKAAEEVIQKYVKLTYDPSTKELVQVVMPFVTASEVTTLRVDKGWVTEASVEDIKLLPGVSRTKLYGGPIQWTDIWKGFGALAGAYVFAALASRGFGRQGISRSAACNLAHSCSTTLKREVLI
jgi:hypothetical protein